MRRKYKYGVLVCALTAAVLCGCGSTPVQEETTAVTEAQTTAAQKTELEQMAELMKQNLELPEYFNEAVNLMASEEWSKAVTEDYTLSDEQGVRMFIQADEGTSAVWFYKEDATLMLKKSKELFYVMETAPGYNGAFTAWILNPQTGDIFHEAGTFTEGVLTGEYTVNVSRGTESSELFSLWNNRETMEYTTYYGNFDVQGRTTVKQLKDTEKIVYAYNETGEKYLYAESSDKTAETAVFTVKTIGLDEMPEQEVFMLRQHGAAVKEEKPQATTSGTQEITKKPTQAVTQAPTQKPTQAVTQKPTQKPTQPATQPPVQEPAEEPTQAPTVTPEPPSLDESGDSSGDVDIEWSGDIL